MGGFAWVTLATNDSYSLGALVLAHSLKKSNTAHKLAVLVTPAVSQPMRDQLETIFDLVKLVDVLDSKDEAHLALMKRPELGVTFTKIHCWRLTEFDKCVFLDADTLVMRNCDELFDREEFSAAPDVSWPDCFNSGVFVYKPSVETFNKLLQFAIENGSFDGGDQGLLNQFFSDWATDDIKKHLPFVYNLTSVAVYSYIPAFKKYGSETRIVHFIGTGKPWLQQLDPVTRTVTPTVGSEHLAPLLQKWWDIFCEKVHPSLNKNLEGENGNSHPPPVEECLNAMQFECADECEMPRLIEPETPYREKNDFRQSNLPYQPFEVKDPSGELINVGFSFAEDKTVYNTQNDENITESNYESKNINCLNDDKSNYEDHYENSNTQQNYCENDQTFLNQENDRAAENKEANENNQAKDDESRETPKEDQHKEENIQPINEPKNNFHFEHFFPDDACINNYLEHNVQIYQPFDSSAIDQSHEKNKNHDGSFEQQPPQLPRFLTMPEDDQRQSGNCLTSSSTSDTSKRESVVSDEKTHPIQRIEERKNEIDLPNSSCSSSEKSADSENFASKLSKSKSMSQLVFDVNLPETFMHSTKTYQAPIASDTGRRYSMPKLKPLLPRENSLQKSSPEILPKVTQYTELLMSSDYKDPVDLPKDKEGFVESQITKRGLIKRSKSDASLQKKFGPLPYKAETEITVPPTEVKPGRYYSDPGIYDFTKCRRQMGNKLKDAENESRKEKSSLESFVGSTEKRKDSKEKQSIEKEGKRRLKKRSSKSTTQRADERSLRNKSSVQAASAHSTHSNNVDEILKKLINFSKDYLHYFGDVNTSHGNSKSSKRKQFVKITKSNDAGEKLENSKIYLSSPTLHPPSRMNEPENMIHSPSPYKSPSRFYQFNRQRIRKEEIEKTACDVEPESSKKETLYITPTNGFERFRTYIQDQNETIQKGLLGIQDVMNSPGSERNPDRKFEPFKNTSRSHSDLTIKNESRLENCQSNNKIRSLLPYKDVRRWRRKFEEKWGILPINECASVLPKEILPLPWKNRYVCKVRATQEEKTKKKNDFRRECSKEDFDTVNSKKTDVIKKNDRVKHVAEKGDGGIGIESNTMRADEKRPVASSSTASLSSSVNLLFKSAEAIESKPKRKNRKKKNSRSLRRKDTNSGNYSRNGTTSTSSNSSPEGLLNQSKMKKENGNSSNLGTYPQSELHKIVVAPATATTSVSCIPLMTTDTFPSTATTIVFTTTTATTTTTNTITNPMSMTTKSESLGKIKTVRNGVEKVRTVSSNCSSGIAGAIAQLNLETGNGVDPAANSQSSAHQEYLRRQNWETGNMDYMGRDSFANIWSKICETIEEKATEDTKQNSQATPGQTDVASAPSKENDSKGLNQAHSKTPETKGVPVSSLLGETVPLSKVPQTKPTTPGPVTEPATKSALQENSKPAVAKPDASTAAVPNKNDSNASLAKSTEPMTMPSLQSPETQNLLAKEITPVNANRPQQPPAGATPPLIQSIPGVMQQTMTASPQFAFLPATPSAVLTKINKSETKSSAPATVSTTPVTSALPQPSQYQSAELAKAPALSEMPKIVSSQVTMPKIPPTSAPAELSSILMASPQELLTEVQLNKQETPTAFVMDEPSPAQAQGHDTSVSGKETMSNLKSEQKKSKGKSNLKGKSQQETGTAVVPYCDIFQSAKEAQVDANAKVEKESHRKSVQETIKKQKEPKTDQFPPIPLPESPKEIKPPVFVTDVSQDGPKPDSEKSDDGKLKKGMISKILDLVGVGTKGKGEKDNESEISKSMFYDAAKADETIKQKETSSPPRSSDKPETKKEEDPVQQLAAAVVQNLSPESPKDQVDATQNNAQDDQKENDKKGSKKGKGKSPKPPPLPEKTGKKQPEGDKKVEPPPKDQGLQSRGNQKEKFKGKKDKQVNTQNKKGVAPKAPEPATQTTASIPEDKDKKKQSSSPNFSNSESLRQTAAAMPTSLAEPGKQIDSSKPEMPPAGAPSSKEKDGISVEGIIMKEIDGIMDKAKTVVQTHLENQKGKGAPPPESGEEINTLKMISGEGKGSGNKAPKGGGKQSNQEKKPKGQPEPKGKKGAKQPGQPLPPPPQSSTEPKKGEELKVTSEEERKKDKQQQQSNPPSKLSDQVLKAIPPPRRKAISESKGEGEANSGSEPAGAIPKNPDETLALKPETLNPEAPKPAENTKEGEGGKGGKKGVKQVSEPVPPPRKPRQKTPPKNKQKK